MATQTDVYNLLEKYPIKDLKQYIRDYNKMYKKYLITGYTKMNKQDIVTSLSRHLHAHMLKHKNFKIEKIVKKPLKQKKSGGDFSSAIQDFFAPVVHAFGQTTEVEEERKAKALYDADTARAQALVDKFKAMSKDDVENQLFKYKNAVDNASGTNRVIAVNALNRWMKTSVDKYPVYFSPEYFRDKGYINQSYLPYKNGKYEKFSDIGLSSLDKYLGSGGRRY